MTTTPGTPACTLTPEGARARLPQARALTERLRERRRTDHRVVLRFADDGTTSTLVDAFVRDERQCCSFFGFTTRHVRDEVILELSAPEDATHMLDAAMAAFDPALDDDQRLALHAEVTTDAPDEQGGCSC